MTGMQCGTSGPDAQGKEEGSTAVNEYPSIHPSPARPGVHPDGWMDHGNESVRVFSFLSQPSFFGPRLQVPTLR